MTRFFNLCILSSLLLAAPAMAEVYKYVDSSGQTHYVDALKKVPEEYRAQIDGEAKLPTISRADVVIPNSPGGKIDRYVSKMRSDVTSGIKKYASQKVEVLMTSWCPVCKDLEKFLRQNRINYSTVDVEKSARGEKLYQSLGGGGVPIVRIGSKVIRGFDATAILRALQQST